MVTGAAEGVSLARFEAASPEELRVMEVMGWLRMEGSVS
jgi:hypothetical protein